MSAIIPVRAGEPSLARRIAHRQQDGDDERDDRQDGHAHQHQGDADAQRHDRGHEQGAPTAPGAVKARGRADRATAPLTRDENRPRRTAAFERRLGVSEFRHRNRSLSRTRHGHPYPIGSPAVAGPSTSRAPTRVRALGYQRTSAMGSSRTSATSGQSAAFTLRRASTWRFATDSPSL